MGDLLIRNIPDALKIEIARAAAEEGTSLSSEAIHILREGLLARSKSDATNGRSAWDALRPLLFDEDDPDARIEFEIMEEVEAERKRDFGRPLPELE